MQDAISTSSSSESEGHDSYSTCMEDVITDNDEIENYEDTEALVMEQINNQETRIVIEDNVRMFKNKENSSRNKTKQAYSVDTLQAENKSDRRRPTRSEDPDQATNYEELKDNKSKPLKEQTFETIEMRLYLVTDKGRDTRTIQVNSFPTGQTTANINWFAVDFKYLKNYVGRSIGDLFQRQIGDTNMKGCRYPDEPLKC